MLESAPRRQEEVVDAGQRQQRRLFMAVIVLLATILVVAFRDRAFWFGGDGEPVAEDADQSTATTSTQTSAAPLAQAPKKHLTANAVNGKAGAKAGHSELQNASETERIAGDQAQQDLSINSPYPLLAGQMAIQGSVLLETLIGADGVVEEMRVLSGPTILVSAAREAVRQWRFKPYLANGQPVETQARVTVNFKIKVSDTVAANRVNSQTSDGEL
ncbi:MAG TPA: energy transducer TonB [Terriglobales bacterium]|nr:energy transducer TonB [Terriglobales bacterium]